jgi:hypothetical protein
MAAIAFVLLADATVAAAELAARTALAAWAQAWGVDGAAELLSCTRATRAEGCAFADTIWRAPEQWHGMRLAWSEDWIAALHRQLFGSERIISGSLSAATAAAAQDQLIAAFGQAYGGPRESADFYPSAFTPGSGALLLTVRLGHGRMRCLLSSLAVAARFPQLSATPLPALPKVRFASVFGSLHVAMQVKAGAAALRLDELASLMPGDVIRLDHPIDRPLPVNLKEGDRLCDGYLGLQGDRVGIELVQHGSYDGVAQ